MIIPGAESRECTPKCLYFMLESMWKCSEQVGYVKDIKVHLKIKSTNSYKYNTVTLHWMHQMLLCIYKCAIHVYNYYNYNF